MYYNDGDIMNDKIISVKIMPNGFGEASEDVRQYITDLNDEIIGLQQENEKLKNNQVKVLNRIRDFINSSKCEIMEGSYCNDKHSQYWEMFKEFAEELQDKIKGLDTKDYVYIPKWREEELLNQEEQLEVYKSCIEKAIEYIKNNWYSKNTTNIDNVVIGDWRIDLLNILQNGSDDNE